MSTPVPALCALCPSWHVAEKQIADRVLADTHYPCQKKIVTAEIFMRLIRSAILRYHGTSSRFAMRARDQGEVEQKKSPHYPLSRRTDTRSAGEPCARAEKNLGRSRFSKFSRSTKYAQTKKKRRLGNAEPRSTEPRRQMLLTTSWSHTSQAGLFWGHRDFPICVFFCTQSCHEVQI